MATVLKKRPRDDIRRARDSKGWSRRDLADKIGSHPMTVEKIETGMIQFSRYIPKIEKVLRLRSTQAAAQVTKTAMRKYLPLNTTPTTALDIVAITYGLAQSADGKRMAVIITWKLEDGSSIQGAMEVKMIRRAARQFHQVALAAGVDLAKLSATEPA